MPFEKEGSNAVLDWEIRCSVARGGNVKARVMGVISSFLGKHKTHRHRMVCDMCSGVIMSSRVVSFRLAPRRLASWRSLPDRLHC